jgi:hypothetical protein
MHVASVTPLGTPKLLSPGLQKSGHAGDPILMLCYFERNREFGTLKIVEAGRIILKSISVIV